MDAYAIGCGVLATIEQWYPTRKFNGTMVPHKRNSKVWPGLVTKEKTIKYPTSAMCTVCVCVLCRLIVLHEQKTSFFCAVLNHNTDRLRGLYSYL